MRPVTLSIVEGKNFILGTFDTTSFQTWWKSLPFPGEVETIEDITHVYGQYHVCIAKMQNGTYSIYRTHDSGKTWTSVYNTSDIIYSITQIDYGHVLASTSTGWLESTLDSGLTWTTISNFAPALIRDSNFVKSLSSIAVNISIESNAPFSFKILAIVGLACVNAVLPSLS